MNKTKRPPLVWIVLSLLAALVATNIAFLILLRTGGPFIGLVGYAILLVLVWRGRRDYHPALAGGLVGFMVHVAEVILTGWTAYPVLMALNLILPAILAAMAWLASRERSNTSMRILIVDDEAPARERLKRLLSDIEGAEVVGEAKDGVRAVEMIEQEQPDLVLLDIQMPGLDGFGVIEALEEPPPVVFVTAYDEHAIRAFEVNALDYLLKPFSRERLEKAIRRAQEEGRDFSAKLGPLLENLAAQGRYLTRLAVRDYENRRIRVLDVSQVDWIAIEAEQISVHVGDKAYPIRRTLAELESRLDPAHFFRAHRSAIVNLDRVQEIIPWFKGSHRLRLTTGAEVELSRAQARALRKILGW